MENLPNKLIYKMDHYKMMHEIITKRLLRKDGLGHGCSGVDEPLNNWFDKWKLPAHMDSHTVRAGTYEGYPQYDTTYTLHGLEKLEGMITDDMVKDFAETYSRFGYPNEISIKQFNTFAVKYDFP